MFLDASAIVAIIARESDGASLSARLDQAAKSYTSAIALYEAALGLARIGKESVSKTKPLLDRFLIETETEVIPIDAALGEAAIAAFERFGRGRHRAALNMGDCFAYACAQRLDVPLLCKGDDFPHTDVTLA
jgi:ribonuclease VapC